MAETQDKSVAIIGAGLFGLMTAKVLQDFGDSFSSITVFEKNASVGGVWAENRIYPGLTSNSPALTYEIPGFQLPKRLRVYGSHIKAEDINVYLRKFVQSHDLSDRIQFNSLVEDVSWDEIAKRWLVLGRTKGVSFRQSFRFLVICNGMYQEKKIPATVAKWHGSKPVIHHSADVGDPAIRRLLSTSKHTLIVGAGKSAIDLATMIAGKSWGNKEAESPQVTLLYQRAHWLSPRAILRGTVYFERLLFSRFLNAWLPYAKSPDLLHRWISQSPFGRCLTHVIFKFISDDFLKSCDQLDLPETIPDHPIRSSLSGALHVVPDNYIQLVRSGKIRIIEGLLASMSDGCAVITTKTGGTLHLPVDNVLCATGYKIAFPFLSHRLLHELGVTTADVSAECDDLPRLRLHRLIVPPETLHLDEISRPYRNIAFNGFAYSLLNPTVGFIAAHWIAEYFLGRIAISSPTQVERDIEDFYSWQCNTFAAHGAKGTHIGSHATLYADSLLEDMRLRTGHVSGTRLDPRNFLQQWFRPMYPRVYASLPDDTRRRNCEKTQRRGPHGDEVPHHVAKVTTIVGLVFLVAMSWICVVY